MSAGNNKRRWKDAALVVAFFLFHLTGITRQGLWMDELYTLNAIGMDYRELVLERLGAGHMPAYFILLKWFTSIFGTGELQLRVPSLLISAAAFALFLRIGRDHIAEPSVRYGSAFLFFIHPFLHWTSLEARMYASVLFLSLLVNFLFLAHAAGGSVRYLRWVGLTLAGALLFHLSFLAYIPIFLILCALRRRECLAVCAGCLFAPAALGAILSAIVYRAKPGNFSSERTSVYQSLYEVAGKPGMISFGKTDHYIFGQGGFLEGIPHLGAIMVALFALLCAGALWRLRREGSLVLQWSFISMFVYLGLMAILAVFGFRKVGAIRYFTVVFPAHVVILACGLASLKEVSSGAVPWVGQGRAHRAVRLSAMILAQSVRTVCATLLFSTAFVQYSWKGHGVREGLAFLQEHVRSGDVIAYHRAKALDPALPLYGAPETVMLSLGKLVNRRESMEREVSSYVKESGTIWLLLYPEKEWKNPAILMKEFDSYPWLDKFVDRRTGVTRVAGYRLRR